MINQENKLYYYLSDQINSTRMITNETGTVVYSAAYDPYGGIQKVWVSTYNPALKFSGKERDTESGLDYFGARYYANFHYRFTSVDPVINRQEALANPQLWNLYAYCRNSPVTYWDPDGMDFITRDQGKRIANEASSWANPPTPYALKGEASKKGEGACCSGSTWKIYKDAGFEYEYRNTKTFSDSIDKGQANEGKFQMIPDQSNPQEGDIGLLNGHMIIYSRKQGEGQEGQDLVWSTRSSGEKKYGEWPLKYFTSGEKAAVWYRYYLPDSPTK